MALLNHSELENAGLGIDHPLSTTPGSRENARVSGKAAGVGIIKHQKANTIGS
jgi:hypothetical protein